MKQKLEQVIADLEHEITLYCASPFEDELDDGAILAYKHAIRRLREVLASDERDNTRNATEPERDDQRQQAE